MFVSSHSNIAEIRGVIVFVSNHSKLTEIRGLFEFINTYSVRINVCKS